MPRLTEITLKNLPVPASGRTTYWDDISPLGVRVTHRNAKTYIVMLGSGSRHTIGRCGNISLAEAREAARRLRAEKTLGRVLPAAVPLAEARKQYLEQLDVRPSTRAYYTRNLNRLKAQRLSDITPADINRILDKLPRAAADQALASLRAFFEWCIRRHHIEKSPCARMALSKSTPRARVLAPDEIRKVWRAALEIGWPYGTLTQLALTLGQRRGELAALRRSWISEKDRVIEFPKEIMKGNKPHSIVYSDMTASIFATIPNTGDLFFPARGKKVPMSGFSKFKNRLDCISGVDWHLHDARRVLASGMAAAGVSLPVIERYLSHTSNTLGGIVQVYQRHTWLPDMKVAAEKYERHLTAILDDK